MQLQEMACCWGFLSKSRSIVVVGCWFCLETGSCIPGWPGPLVLVFPLPKCWACRHAAPCPAELAVSFPGCCSSIAGNCSWSPCVPGGSHGHSAALSHRLIITCANRFHISGGELRLQHFPFLRAWWCSVVIVGWRLLAFLKRTPKH